MEADAPESVVETSLKVDGDLDSLFAGRSTSAEARPLIVANEMPNEMPGTRWAAPGGL